MEISLEDYFGQGAKLDDNAIVLKWDILLRMLDPNREEIFNDLGHLVRARRAEDVVSLSLAVLHKTAAPPTTDSGIPLIDTSKPIVAQNALESMSFITRDGKKFIEHKFNFNVYTKGFEVFPLQRVSPRNRLRVNFN